MPPLFLVPDSPELIRPARNQKVKGCFRHLPVVLDLKKLDEEKK